MQIFAKIEMTYMKLLAATKVLHAYKSESHDFLHESEVLYYYIAYYHAYY